MIISDFNSLFKTLSERGKRRLVVANGTDNHTLEAVSNAFDNNLVTVKITGRKDLIESECTTCRIDVNKFEIIDCPDEQSAVDTAVEIASKGGADLIMKGLISTDVYVKSILRKDTGLLEEGSLLSHVTVILNKSYPKPLIVSDVAVIPLPTLEQKVRMTEYLIDVAHKLGIQIPKVAFLAASEKVSQRMQATLDANELKKLWENGRFPDSLCDGPMALDLAIDPESVEIKNFISPVAGDADCLLFPNIESGNVFYKVNTKFCNAETAAILVGTKVPVILSSRGDTIQTKLNSIALAALLG
ncbi:MAG: hypothetical protein KA807_11315 [Prolixibacteraceae bacterium]|nr:hypothetical protein [Prolixibacteraceae bacterium]